MWAIIGLVIAIAFIVLDKWAAVEALRPKQPNPKEEKRMRLYELTKKHDAVKNKLKQFE